MELKNVTTFVKIAKLNNFTRAAESLGYSQAAVTAQIKQLEAELGAPLFDRIGRGIRLSSAGEIFLPKAIELLNAEKAAIASIKSSLEPEGNLRITVTASLAANVMPDIMMNFSRRYPQIHMIVEVTDIMRDAVRSLRNGKSDLLFFVENRVELDGFVKVYERKEDNLLVTSPVNEISHIKRPSYERIFSEPFVEFSHDSNFSRYFREALANEGVEMKSTMEIESLSAILSMLLKGYGMSFLPGFIANPYIKAGQLKEIDFDLPEYKAFENYSQMFSLKDRWINPQMTAFIDFLQKREILSEEDGV